MYHVCHVHVAKICSNNAPTRQLCNATARTGLVVESESLFSRDRYYYDPIPFLGAFIRPTDFSITVTHNYVAIKYVSPIRNCE